MPAQTATVHRPASSEELTDVLKEVAQNARPVEVFGSRSKQLWGGPVVSSADSICMAGLNRVLRYERNDLTISVEAGAKFSDVQELLARNGQMIALDPPCSKLGTVGGIVATNGSGPLRRGYGTARDLVIGMRFATLEGKLIQSGGMVVKNVAGLDMAKIMIGSYGTLAVLVRVNFRVHPIAESTATFLLSNADRDAVFTERDRILRSPLRPISLEILNPPAATQLGLTGFVLALRAGGSARVVDRYRRELPKLEVVEGNQEASFWDAVREFTPDFLARHTDGVVIRAASKLEEIPSVLNAASGPAISRAASGVSYLYSGSWDTARDLVRVAAEKGWKVAVEAAHYRSPEKQQLYLGSDSVGAMNGFANMKGVKSMFDPQNLLNPLRLYGRI